MLNKWLKTTYLVSGEIGSIQVDSPQQFLTKLYQDMWEEKNIEPITFMCIRMFSQNNYTYICNILKNKKCRFFILNLHLLKILIR